MFQRQLSAFGLCLALAACQPPPPMVDPTTIPPPANLDATTPAPPGMAQPSMPPGFDGRYAGAMFLTRDVGGACTAQVPVTGMSVAGNMVRFGQFPPTGIGPDGGIQMVEGRIWLTGRFDGRQFVGAVTQGYPGCEYRMVLNRS